MTAGSVICSRWSMRDTVRDWDDVGYGYEALVGRPGESQGFNISWAQFLRPRDMERKLILEPGDPGYVSFEEVQATVEALEVQSR